MVTEQKAAEVLAGIAAWRAEHLDEELDEDDVIGWIPEFGVAISIHGEDVDDVADYYRSKLEDDVAECTGGAVVISDVQLLRVADDYEYLYFRRNGEPVWWHVEHQSDDYVDQGAVSEQFSDLDPGGADPRLFHQICRSKIESCQDDIYVLATSEQAAVLRDEFGLDFYDVAPPPRSDPNPPAAEPDSLAWYMAKERGLMTEFATTFLDRWLSDMVPALVAWRIRFLPKDFPFDFGVDSLYALEILIRRVFDDWSAVASAAADPFVTGAVRYLGQTFIRNAPCHWAFWDSDGSIYHRIPLIRSNTPTAFQDITVPLHRLARVAESREPGALAEALQDMRDATLRYESACRALA